MALAICVINVDHEFTSALTSMRAQQLVPVLCMALVWSWWLPSLSIADEVDVSERIKLCEGCHGVSGVPVTQDIPVLTGQEYYYLYVQLKDYKAGRRANSIMSEIAKDMTKDEMKAFAEHFASMPWPRIVAKTDDNKASSGETALAAGQCSQCHSTYQGDSRVPRLAGQQLPYLTQTMLDFKNKVRLNSPAKSSLMDSYSDEDVVAMAHYLANLQ